MMYDNEIWLRVIFKIEMLLSTIERFSIAFVRLNNIMSNGFMTSVSNDRGYIIMDIKGTNIMFIKGLRKFISKKLFINIGIEAIKAM